MSEKTKIELLPAACIDMGIHFFEDELPFSPRIKVIETNFMIEEDIDIFYTGVEIGISSCEVEVLLCRTEYGQYIRAYRILSIKGLFMKAYNQEAFDGFFVSERNVLGFVVLEDAMGRRSYVIDRWYDDDKEREHDLELDKFPDLLAGLHLMTRPNMEKSWAIAHGHDWQ